MEDLTTGCAVDLVIDNRSGHELPLARLEGLAAFVCGREAAGRREAASEVEISLSFVDEEESARLNAAWRGKDGPTDVLSFELDGLCGELDAAFGPGAAAASGRVLLGDIVIQPDIARRRAAAEGIGFEQELWVLLVHGILHLVGYDHLTDADAERMEAREDEHLLEWGRRDG
ncbi:MAG: rRNA maturation RNase YbeY [Coriobacteriales bacterium]|jgi:probable rRNA maturation factor|nr:rRNA maturation RNase YbeY [Coriobacteriales bacterium]